MAPFVQLLVDNCNELAEVLPLHIFAFPVEIKPGVFDTCILELCDNFTHLGADPQLATLLINKVDEVLFAVLGVGLLQVVFSGSKTLVKVGVDVHRRAPLHRRLHLPDEGDRSSDLCVGRNLESCTRLHLQNVLRLSEISGCSLTVKATSDESAAGSPAISPRDKRKVHLKAYFLNGHKAMDTGRAEWRTLKVHEIRKHLVVESVFRDIVHTVGGKVDEVLLGSGRRGG